MSILLISFAVVAVILLFASMVLSAMAADNINKANNSKSTDDKSIKERYLLGHRYAKYSAIVTGLGVLCIVIVGIIMMYASPSKKAGAVPASQAPAPQAAPAVASPPPQYSSPPPAQPRYSSPPIDYPPPGYYPRSPQVYYPPRY